MNGTSLASLGRFGIKCLLNRRVRRFYEIGAPVVKTVQINNGRDILADALKRKETNIDILLCVETFTLFQDIFRNVPLFFHMLSMYYNLKKIPFIVIDFYTLTTSGISMITHG